MPMAALCLLAAPVYAQTADGISMQAPIVASPCPAATSANAVLRAGTPMQLQMLEEVTTKKKAAKVEGPRIRLPVSVIMIMQSSSPSQPLRPPSPTAPD